MNNNNNTTITIYKSLFPSDRMYRIVYFSILACAILLALVGTTGNILSVLVLRRPKMKNTTSATYMQWLAAIDTFLLNLILIPFNTIPFLHLWDASNSFAKGYVCLYIYPFFNWLSSVEPWIIVAMTADRAIVVSLPTKAKSICTKKRANLLCTVLLVLLMIFHFQKYITVVGARMIIMPFNRWLSIPSCIYKNELSRILNGSVLGILMSLCTGILPAFFLIITNIIIVYGLIKADKKRKTLTSEGSSAENSSKYEYNINKGKKSSCQKAFEV